MMIRNSWMFHFFKNAKFGKTTFDPSSRAPMPIPFLYSWVWLARGWNQSVKKLLILKPQNYKWNPLPWCRLLDLVFVRMGLSNGSNLAYLMWQSAGLGPPSRLNTWPPIFLTVSLPDTTIWKTCLFPSKAVPRLWGTGVSGMSGRAKFLVPNMRSKRKSQKSPCSVQIVHPARDFIFLSRERSKCEETQDVGS